MIFILLGLALWSAAHFWKRIAPAHRAGFGDKGKGVVAVASVLAIVLMVIGYRMADGAVFWGRSGMTTGLNNLLMVLAIYLFAASGSKARITKTVRHPQLTAVMVWAAAHILVNGDTPSFVLFGGMFIWALAEVVLINRAEGPRGPYHAVPQSKEISAAVATVIVFIVVGAVHALLGYNPFG